MQFFTPLPEVQTGMPQTANALRDMTQGAQYRNDMAFRREQAGAENKRAENYLRLAQSQEARVSKSDAAREGRETTKFGWEEKDREVKKAIEQVGMVANIAGSVSDQTSHDQAISQLQQMQVDTSKIPPTFDPKYWQQQMKSALTAKDHITRKWAEQDKADEQKFQMKKQGASDDAAMNRTLETIKGHKEVAGMRVEDPTRGETNYLKASEIALKQATDPMGNVDQEAYQNALDTLLGGMGRKTAQPAPVKKGGWQDHLSPETKAAMQGGKPGPEASAQPAQPGTAPPTQPIQPVQAAPQDRQNALKATAQNPMEYQRGSYTAPNGKVVNWEDIKDTAQKMWSMTGIDQAANAVWKGLGFVGDASIDFVKWLAAQQAEQRKQLPAYRGQ